MANDLPLFYTSGITPADIPAIFDIETDCFKDPWSMAAVAQELSAPHAGGMTARCAATHRIAAYIFFRRVLDEMHILKVATARPWQRRHGACLLVDEVIRRAREMGLRQVFLEVRASNTAAIKLYEKTGFTVAGRRPGYYYDDNDDAIMMIHLLKEA